VILDVIHRKTLNQPFVRINFACDKFFEGLIVSDFSLNSKL